MPRRRPSSPRRRKSARIRKILIANRGEIAVRILRTCRSLEISPVAVYSEADAHALHVRMADEAHLIGPAPAARSYLDIPAILEAARRSGADAIHPGYGFLAENAEFARACRQAGLVFIGPAPEAMERLGNKIEARRRMEKAGVPVIPGIHEPGLDPAALRKWARRVGYPILLKAAAGGGGRGMRVVRREEELEAAFRTAGGEARSAFGDGTLFAERYLEGARHIEVQVLVDGKGNGVSLGERECSLQRRHQKLVEESPSPVVDEATRRRLGRLALKACAAAGYTNAGTVEFLRDDAGEFRFLEVNARLQVEHPITEAVMGLDLVEAQIRVAAGETLPEPGVGRRPRGWAIECRIQAEDPAQGFLPSPGRITLFRPPQGPRIRIDTGVTEGDEISLHYDSLLAKVIAWGADRPAAIRAMSAALAEFRIGGVQTTLPFHREAMADEEFRRGEIDTGFVERMLARARPDVDDDLEAVALLAAAHLHQTGRAPRPAPPAAGPDAWLLAGRQAQHSRMFPGRNPWRWS